MSLQMGKICCALQANNKTISEDISKKYQGKKSTLSMTKCAVGMKSVNTLSTPRCSAPLQC
uniref:Uncharacterized protein n=1 Tax=Aegilops tauschii subsp. strangulata TaxID=200361 RepID=A0A452ZK98_AEGTS